MTNLGQKGAPNVSAAVHSVHEFVFSAPDLNEAERFYSAFGLDVRHEESGLALFTFGHAQRWGRILKGPRKRLLWLTLGIFQEDQAAFEEKIRALDINRIPAPPEATPHGIWIADP